MNQGTAPLLHRHQQFSDCDHYDIDAAVDIWDAQHPLPSAVEQADLTKYELHQLEGRRAHYEREAVFERDPELRAALKGEVERTDIELNRRKMYRVAEAERVFKL